MINVLDIRNLGLEIEDDLLFQSLALSNTTLINSLSFLDNEKFLNEINSNKNIIGCIVSSDLSSLLINKHVIISEDPRFDFYNLLNIIGKKNYIKEQSIISSSATIHPTAYVSDFNVKIGDNTIIHPNVTILADVEIGSSCIIQSGAVLGSEGFEYKKTSKGILSVFHDGKVKINDRVEIGANTCIDKGFSFRNTIIESEVKVDNLVHVAHGVHIKSKAFIIAGTILGGSTTICENAWTSINASIAPGITIMREGFVSIGAVVTKNVNEGEQVTGNLAIEHKKFIEQFKRNNKI